MLRIITKDFFQLLCVAVSTDSKFWSNPSAFKNVQFFCWVFNLSSWTKYMSSNDTMNKNIPIDSLEETPTSHSILDRISLIHFEISFHSTFITNWEKLSRFKLGEHWDEASIFANRFFILFSSKRTFTILSKHIIKLKRFYYEKKIYFHSNTK